VILWTSRRGSAPLGGGKQGEIRDSIPFGSVERRYSIVLLIRFGSAERTVGSVHSFCWFSRDDLILSFCRSIRLLVDSLSQAIG
jgi:hypothetical protein